MREIPLTKGYVALVDDEDYARLAKYKWCASEYANGKVYALRSVLNSRGVRTALMMHRSILGLKAGDGLHVDHIDHNGLNNQKSNLRACSPSRNAQNRRKLFPTSSTYKGVSWDKSRGRWHVAIKLRDRCLNIGRFDVERDAAIAHDIAALTVFGDYAECNFPEGL